MSLRNRRETSRDGRSPFSTSYCSSLLLFSHLDGGKQKNRAACVLNISVNSSCVCCQWYTLKLLLIPALLHFVCTSKYISDHSGYHFGPPSCQSLATVQYEVKKCSPERGSVARYGNHPLPEPPGEGASLSFRSDHNTHTSCWCYYKNILLVITLGSLEYLSPTKKKRWSRYERKQNGPFQTESSHPPMRFFSYSYVPSIRSSLVFFVFLCTPRDRCVPVLGNKRQKCGI